MPVYLVIVKSCNWDAFVLLKHEAVLVVRLVVFVGENDFYAMFSKIVFQFLWS